VADCRHRGPSRWAALTKLADGSGLAAVRSIGHVIDGMHRQGYDVQLTLVALCSIPLTQNSPWAATQRAAWEVLRR
jgi:hypothetical protein